MAGLMKSSFVVFMVMMMVASTTMAQTRHVVGGPMGWTIPNPTNGYTTWASQQTFAVGDTLYFNFTTGNHDVAEVAQAAYGPCTTTNPISRTTTGPATITLSAAGNHYYICTVGTHCQIGQKLTINVVAAATPTTPPPAAAPSTPPPATIPTASPPTSTPSPAPMSPPTPSATTPTPDTTPAPSPVGASPPSPPISGPSPSGTSPSPATVNSPPPPSPSAAARSFATVVPASFLAVALALFF